MEPHWSNRIWDMYIDAYYAKFTNIHDVINSKGHWVFVASKRHSDKYTKWYGL